MVVKVRNVWKIYKVGKVYVEALRGVDLEIKKGEFVSIFGPSGSGKSTLLHILGLLDTPTKGEVLFNGKRVDKMSEEERARLRLEEIGFVFQTFNLLPFLNAWENVAFPLLIKNVPLEERKKRALHLLKKVGLLDRAEHKPNEMSGGQRQRVAIARALSNNPSVIFADEPTGNLDSKAGREVMEIFKKLNEEGVTVVVVTHDEVVKSYSSRVVYIRDGKVVGDEYI